MIEEGPVGRGIESNLSKVCHQVSRRVHECNWSYLVLFGQSGIVITHSKKARVQESALDCGPICVDTWKGAQLLTYATTGPHTKTRASPGVTHKSYWSNKGCLAQGPQQYRDCLQVTVPIHHRIGRNWKSSWWIDVQLWCVDQCKHTQTVGRFYSVETIIHHHPCNFSTQYRSGWLSGAPSWTACELSNRNWFNRWIVGNLVKSTPNRRAL